MNFTVLQKKQQRDFIILASWMKEKHKGFGVNKNNPRMLHQVHHYENERHNNVIGEFFSVTWPISQLQDYKLHLKYTTYSTCILKSSS